MTPDLLIDHPGLAAFLVALVANLFVAGVVYGVSGVASRHLAQVVGWCLRTFTAAGDNCHSCIDCRRWALPVACLSCGRTRVMTATSTIPTDGPTAARIATARAHADARAVSFEDRRIQRAQTAFDEIDLDLEDTVAH